MLRPLAVPLALVLCGCATAPAADLAALKQQVAEAPFSWEPAQVEVLDSGTLALSSGPVCPAPK